MTLKRKLLEDLKLAMREQNTIRKYVIRSLRAEIHNREIDLQSDLDDNGVISVINKQAKQHRESIDAFQKGNRQDLVDKEEAELAVIVEYLPPQMSEQQLVAFVKQTINKVGATGPQDMGLVMSTLMPQITGKAEGSEINKVTARLLSDVVD